MTSPTLIAVRATTAARMLDMSVTEFRALVGQGALPPPVTIAGRERWPVEALQGILSRDAAKPQEFEL